MQQDLRKEEKKDATLIRLGWVTAFLMPIVGFFIGLASAIRGSARHGVGIMVTAVLVTVVLAMAIVGSAASSVDKPLNDAQARLNTTTPPSQKATHAEPKAGAISFNQYRSVKTGRARPRSRACSASPATSPVTRPISASTAA